MERETVVTKRPAERHYESAQEEFQRRVKELYALADKMGLRLAITVKSKSPQEQFAASGKRQRQPGEN